MQSTAGPRERPMHTTVLRWLRIGARHASDLGRAAAAQKERTALRHDCSITEFQRGSPRISVVRSTPDHGKIGIEPFGDRGPYCLHHVIERKVDGAPAHARRSEAGSILLRCEIAPDPICGDALQLVSGGAFHCWPDAKPDDASPGSPDLSLRSPKERTCLPPKITR